MRKLINITIALVVFFISSSCMALDISISKHELSLSGEIIAGDAERVAKAMYSNDITSLVVNIPGGDVSEALKIASLVKGSLIRLRVAGKGGYCASACFFLYIAAEDRTAHSAKDNGQLRPNWQSNAVGAVGVHRPYVKFTGQNANKTIETEEQVVRESEAYLKAQRVPQHLIDEMLSRPSNAIYWLNSKDIQTIGQYNPGYEEALVSKCGYISTQRLLHEINWSESQINDYLEKFISCERDFWWGERYPLTLQFYSKLKTGWRPWQKVMEWVNVGHNKNITFYANYDAMSKDGNSVKFWTLNDYKTAKKLKDGAQYLSRMDQHEFECKEAQWRLIDTFGYSENMGRGKVVYSYNGSRDWNPIPPGSNPIKTVWGNACGKK